MYFGNLFGPVHEKGVFSTVVSTLNVNKGHSMHSIISL